MKKIVLVALVSFFIFSCGNKTEKQEEVVDDKAVVVDEYSLTINGIYEIDDVVSVVYKKDGYFVEKPIEKVVKGSPLPQQITIELPKGDKVENMSVNLSSNKEQNELSISAVIIKNGDQTILSDKENFTTYFLFNESVTWNVEKSKYVLFFDKKFPPGMSGGEQLEALLDR